jgi:hypothetical protein
VNDIVREQQWNLESGFSDRAVLQLSRSVGAKDIEKGSDASGSNRLLIGRGYLTKNWKLIELAQLLVECHQPKQRVGEFRRARGVERGARGLCAERGCEDDSDCEQPRSEAAR